MVIGACKIFLNIDEVYSLKEKRHIIKSIIGRTQSKFNVAVAEVDFNDKWKNSAIGISCVSNDTSHVDSIMSNIVNFLEKDGRAEVTDFFIEKIHID